MKTCRFPLDRSFDAIIDVRSPQEYALDHIPGALSLPSLSDTERAEVGTLDRQVGQFEARRRGAALISRNIADHLDRYFADKPRHFSVLLYCWRGGLRSGGFAQVLERVGFSVATLEGGYKAFRAFVVQDLQRLAASRQFVVLDGPTGSGKTAVLQALARRGSSVIDLEALANHKGSLLGAEAAPQPSQKGFETQLWWRLQQAAPGQPIWVEGESAKIGERFIPPSLFAALKAALRQPLVAAPDQRAAYLLATYVHYCDQPQDLLALLERFRYRYGGAQVLAWQKLVEQGAYAAFVKDLLATHYDPAYAHAAARMPTSHRLAPLELDPCDHGSIEQAAESLLQLRL